MLTKEEYDKIPIGTIFREGISTNSSSGIYMTDNDLDRLLKWVAIKRIEGWCIYIEWKSKPCDSEWIAKWGNKVNDTMNVYKLVPCEPAILQLYIK